MRIRKSYKYKNYGPIPKKEYCADNTEKNTDSAPLSVNDPKPDGAAYRKRLIKRQTLNPTGRSKIRSWARSWKKNGWRAESAALQDEISDKSEMP